MKANETKPIPLQYAATTSEAGYRRLEDALEIMGNLRNALIRHRNAARGSHRHAFTFKLQNAHLTDLHRNDPDFNAYARKLLESVAREVNKSYKQYFKHPDVGWPRTASPYKTRTLEISEPASEHVKVKPDGHATIRVKGLPVIRFQTDHRMPEHEQPKVIRITLKPRRLVVSLIYQLEPKNIGAPDRESVGIDPGVKQNITAVSDDGNILQIPGFDSKPHFKIKRRLLRKMQRQRDQALKDGRARFISQTTRTGKIKRRFRWNERPSKGYLKTLAQLRKVEQKRQDSMNGHQHRVSHRLVKDHKIICIEDTQIGERNSRGTRQERQTESRPEPGNPRTRLVRPTYQDRVQSRLVQPPFRRCTRAPHQPALFRVWTRRRRQPGQPISIPMHELPPRSQRRRERGRKYPASRCRNLGQGRKPQPGCTAGDPRGQQTQQNPPQGGLALYTRTRSPQGVAKFPIAGNNDRPDNLNRRLEHGRETSRQRPRK